ncbi:hypothetical protein GOBAR_AA15645 [Gossypium barbadense]|uniref:Protein kinase domain-containing protein n=1 Tax=Gossypium barbadense TaxID=3634 RepID=A0A2P5XNW0_GOSBA|nr:hypothetical protein GOBAR_AA15645 [Gossypium barbadense]
MVVIIASSFTFLLLLIINIALALETTSTTISGAKDRCKGSYGNVSCNESSTPPTILKKINMEVFNFSYGPNNGCVQYLRVKSLVILDNCSGRKIETNNQTVNLTSSPFFYLVRNKFIVVGCNNKALITGIKPRIVGCDSTCNGNIHFGISNPNKTCNGSTCCETIITSYLQTFNASFERKNSSGPQGCKLAFVVDEEWLNFNITNPSDLLNMDNVPALIDWVLPNGSTSIFSRERIYSYGRYTSESSNISRRYFCRDGYRGNPYLPIGCQDIDECQEECHKISCGDATCIGVGCGLLKRRRKVKLKKKFFKRNGGWLIAKETAEAFWYLHSSASIPIYHRDIKSSNILLDEKFKEKVSDFGTSRSISIDQTHLTTHVHGTFGYLDPEYFQSSQFTKKSDVYNFGVVLVELLTGEKPIFSLERKKEGRSLATYFISSMEENQVMEIVDARVVGQAKDDELMMVAKVAYRCLSLSGKKRPTMKEVAIQLDQILPLLKDSNVDHHHNQEEIVHLKLDLPFLWDSTSSSINSSFFSRNICSIEKEPLV